MNKYLKFISVLLVTILVTSSPPVFAGGGFSGGGSGGSGSASISDTAYDATTWDGDTTNAPSKNAVRDKIELLKLYTDATNNNYGFGENTFAAIIAGSTENTAVGDNALHLMQDSDQNTAVGYNALGGLVSTSGAAGWNTAVGYAAMSGALTTAAVKNTVVGGNSGLAMTSATLTTCVGYHSCQLLDTGNNNTAIGVDSQNAMVSGSTNTSVGYSSLSKATTSQNVCVGGNACNLQITGANVVALGYRAGATNVSGSSDVYLGDQAGYNNALSDKDNQILIGATTSSNFANHAVIGNTSVTGVDLLGSTRAPIGTALSLGMPGTAARVWGLNRNGTSAQSGSNLTLQAGGASAVGQIITVSITAGGTGYTLGDTITINGAGDGLATVGVTAVSGGVVTAISRVTLGSGYSVASGVTTTGGTGSGFTANITGVGTATDKNGGTTNIAPGVSTGTGNAKVSIQGYTKATSTGSTDNTIVDRYVVTGAKALTDAATSLFEIALPTLTMAGGSIEWTIEASDGTNMQSLSGITTYAAVNKAGTYTTTVTNDTANDAKAVSSGTLTTAWAFLNGTNKVTMQVTPTGSLTETTYRVTYTVTNNSPQAITIL